MASVLYKDRITGKVVPEKVYGEKLIQLIYGNGCFAQTIGKLLLHLFKWPCVSHLFGYLQSLPNSKKKIAPFIKEYDLDPHEFEKIPEDFTSFNDFFIRHLKKGARSIAHGVGVAIIPADGRYLAYENLSKSALFSMKGCSYTIQQFLQTADSSRYHDGTLVLARLCPIDCHRFFFPIDGTPSESHLINGKLFSVNPVAVRKYPWIFFENKRSVTHIESPLFGKIAFVEIGATNVGSIHQTYEPYQPYLKGDEKGYFSFGGSALAMFFEKGAITIDADLLEATAAGLEMRCLIGQSLGRVSS